jgi:RluA family pseudouridine synthase
MPKQLEIIYQDDHVVAVNKPAGLASIPGRGETTSLLEQLGKELGLPVTGDADPRLRVVHRLDKDTSGVMLFAKNVEAQRFLSHQFQNNTVQKEYVALVIGRPVGEEGEIDAPIAADRYAPGKMMVHKRGKPARTLWKLEKAYRALTLLRAFPKTGKTHQIRVHLAHMGHPLAVDELYGPAPDEKGHGIFLSRYKRGYQLGKHQEERPLVSRLTLHAEKLRVELEDGREIELLAEMPKDLRATINMLDKYGH